MPSSKESKPVERLFPFALRARILLVGRETLGRSRSKLQFVLLTTDVSENTCREVVAQFQHYPVVQHFTSTDLERLFGLRATKVLGFTKSSLAQSIYSELKTHRINTPAGSPLKKNRQPRAKPDTHRETKAREDREGET
jgi:hypothetical protein